MIRKVAFAAMLLMAAGCAAPKPTRLAKAFIPPAPAASKEVYIAGPPPEIYSNEVTPNPILEQYRLAVLPTPSDLLIAQADEAYRRGKGFYQSGDQVRARRQFDRAIQLLFQSPENPTDRTAFERQLEAAGEG